MISFLWVGLSAQEKAKDPFNASTFSGIKMRNVGPAFTSGRIADIAVHPTKPHVWYVGVASGGVWLTENAGNSWKPIFDKQPVYSIGCVTIDEKNPNIIWVGTGENVGGRHIAFGDGVYKSTDGGMTWKNMGLEKSEHLSRIIVHPENSDVVWVASQGPLWSAGGERGLYKTTDGGETWKKVLGDEEWTGVTDLVIDPRNPDVLYAATWQRHRTIAAYMGGGPKSGLHRSLDGGETWEKLSNGLPKSNIGKIGLAISPQNPDILYAALELNRRKGAVYRSSNRGASWEKRSNTVSGGTGPHYYQELYACPHHFDRIYLMDVRVQVSHDGGKNFDRLNENGTHSDKHAIAFHPNLPEYILLGSDGGLYETYDNGENWRFIDNMPITQYYKVAVDDAKPFYFIYGGTQDNGSHGGPSRTDNVHGIRNDDWFKTLGADGHQSATEPGNPNIMYAETQQGGLHRVDRITGEQVNIQPQPQEGEDFERFNWDAPILVSAHDPTRLYFASYRVWRSENRGDSWTPISGDLTKNEQRLSLPIMGKQQSWDSPWDVLAMSNYNTITSLGESPIDENIVYAGTDDGLVQITQDGGQNWTEVKVGSMPGVPATAFVNDIRADLHDANTVYLCLDNHKYGDYKPYVLKSTDKGRTWKSISANLPEKTLVWRIVQDHVDPNLLFLATEFGIYFTNDGGGKWVKIKGGVPTISFRDITIHRTENDLIGASFGRGFYILDDISPLRNLTEETLQADATLFQPKDAWMYNQKSIVSSQGTAAYAAENPPYGAVFTYHLNKTLPKPGAERKKMESKLKKEGKDIPFPGWDEIEAERSAASPKIWLIVKDETGKIVNRISGSTSKGFHRVAWNLREASKSPVSMSSRGGGRWGRWGFHVLPGTYSVALAEEVDGVITELTEPKEFKVVPLREGALKGKSPAAIAQFRADLNKFSTEMSVASETMDFCKNKMSAIRTAIDRSQQDASAVLKNWFAANQALTKLDMEMNGNPSKEEIGEKQAPNVRSWYSNARRGSFNLYGPTETNEQSLRIAESELEKIMEELKVFSQEKIPALEDELESIGAPMIQSPIMPKNH